MITANDILGARILIVDDQHANVRMLQRLLADASYREVTATMLPAEVCALHRQHDFDLILLDLQMPGTDGFQVMEALKTIERDPYLPVIVLTSQPGHKLRALSAGAKDFISKPLDLSEVRTRITNMLEIRLLYRQLALHNSRLEATVLERTQELRESEARFRSLTELASDWYWEQDEAGAFTKVSGPVLEMLGIQVNTLTDGATQDAHHAGWNEAERAALLARITAREPFLDFPFSCQQVNGTCQQFRVSGQPMFDRTCRFVGYRGVGVEVVTGNP